VAAREWEATARRASALQQLPSVVAAAGAPPGVQSPEVVSCSVQSITPASATTPSGPVPAPAVTDVRDSSEPHPEDGIAAGSESEDIPPTTDAPADDGEQGFPDGGDWMRMDEIEATGSRADIEAAAMGLGFSGITPQTVELT